MTLNELIKIWESNAFGEDLDLGDGWKYSNLPQGFTIQYLTGVGGLRILVSPDIWSGNMQEKVDVHRIINNKTELVFEKVKDEENDIELKHLHYGVNQRLKYVLGY